MSARGASTLMKYPRTFHLEGSRLRPDDEDRESVPFSTIAGRRVVVEEKVDGANSGLSFGEDGGLLLQSRGHYLTGGPRERHFALFKKWASVHQERLLAVLGTRYVVYGEWLYAKHTVFYDLLPHYWLEFDVWDKKDQNFLSTPRRRDLLSGLPILSVPILFSGTLRSPVALTKNIGPSCFISSDRRERLRQECRRKSVCLERTLAQTDLSGLMEGLYIKVEDEGRVLARYKFVRGDFLAEVDNSGDHWLNRPIVPNLLADGADIFGQRARK